ncbi:MAG TPA: hypothetical protein VGP72_07580, partial [Planctomycetota bacterium]
MENERDGVTGGRGDGGKQHDGEHDGAGKDVCGTNCGAAANLTPQPPSLGGKGEKGSARDAGGTAGAGELTGEELKDPWKAMFSAGVAKMFEARKALTAQELGDAGAGGDEEVFRFVAECEKFGDAEAERRREERKDRRMNAEAI